MKLRTSVLPLDPTKSMQYQHGGRAKL